MASRNYLTDQELEKLLNEDDEDNVLLFNEDGNEISINERTEADLQMFTIAGFNQNLLNVANCDGDTMEIVSEIILTTNAEIPMELANNTEINTNNEDINTKEINYEEINNKIDEDYNKMKRIDGEDTNTEEANNDGINNEHLDNEEINKENINNEEISINEEASSEETNNFEIIENSRKINKFRRMRGQSYKGLKKNEKNYEMSELKPKRTLGVSCDSKKCRTSKNRSCSKFEQPEREEIFKYFWNKLNWDSRKQYVCSLINAVPRRRALEESRRSITYQYFLKSRKGKNLQVCKTMFLRTLGLKGSMVNDWCGRSIHGMHETDKKMPSRGKHKSTKFSDGRKKLNNFFHELPKLESHYCRASTQKLYLEPHFTTKNDLYRHYKLYCIAENTKNVLSKRVFLEEFDKLNLALHHPKKDQCDTCISFSLGNISEEEHNLHIKKKEAARDEKQRDKAKALEHTNEIAMFTIDVQAVMLAPFLNASAIYYKTKLCVHNYTIWNMTTKDVTCYLWHEGEGGLDANIFTTLLINFLDNYLCENPRTKEIIIYTDGCSYQNKSSTLANGLFHFAREKNITITHKYLVKGHTHMEVDSAHSLIERKKKHREIYLPTDYISICREARISQPFVVRYVTHKIFQDFKDLKYYTNIRPGTRRGDPTVSDFVCLKYTPSEIFYKLSYDSDDYQAYKKKPTIGNYIVRPLYKSCLKIKASKYAHLQELKKVIPHTAWDFYDNLQHD